MSLAKLVFTFFNKELCKLFEDIEFKKLPANTRSNIAIEIEKETQQTFIEDNTINTHHMTFLR